MGENRRKILIISAYDVGGASIAAIRMHMGLLATGQDSRFLSLHASQDHIPQHYRFSPPGDSVSRLKLKWKQRREHQLKTSLQLPEGKSLSGEFSMPVAAYELTHSELFEWADVVVAHWVNEWLPFENLMELARHKPLIWVMHDMHAFSGGCHYNHGCIGLKQDCGNCPMLEGSNMPDLARRFWKDKIRSLQQIHPNLTITAPSQWMVNWSKQSSLFQAFPHFHIFNSLDTRIFCPREKEACRKVLGIPLDKKVGLCVIQNLGDHRKGFSILLAALQLPEIKNQLLLCSVGKSKNLPQIPDIEHLNFGTIQDERMMAIIYNAADFLIHPAIEDNLPNVVVEGLACGLPCAGFQIGGMPEMIQDGKNGFLAKETNPEALSQCTLETLRFPWEREKIAAEAAGKFTLEVQANQMIQLVENVIHQTR